MSGDTTFSKANFLNFLPKRNECFLACFTLKRFDAWCTVKSSASVEFPLNWSESVTTWKFTMSPCEEDETQICCSLMLASARTEEDFELRTVHVYSDMNGKSKVLYEHVFLAFDFCRNLGGVYDYLVPRGRLKQVGDGNLLASVLTTVTFTANDEQIRALSVSPAKNLTTDIRKLLESGTCGDVIVRASNDNITAHHFILEARCPGLVAEIKNLGDSDIDQRGSNPQIDMSDFTYEAVMAMLRYIYGAQMPKFNWQLATEVLRISTKFQLPELKSASSSYLTSQLTVSNATELLLLGHECRAKMLIRKVIDFICNNSRCFNFDANRSVLIEHPHLLFEIAKALGQRK